MIQYMIEPKPLTAEQRDKLAKYLGDAQGDVTLASTIMELLAAEAYWREVVKKAEPEARIEYGDFYYALCPWCKESEYDPHRPDCQWLKAQE